MDKDAAVQEHGHTVPYHYKKSVQYTAITESDFNNLHL